MPKFIADNSWVDPTLELDIYGDKPWALSPALAGMSNIAFDEEEKHPWVEEKSAKVVETESTDEKSEIAARRKWFGDASKRSEISLKDEIAMEFANGLLGRFSEDRADQISTRSLRPCPRLST